MNNYQRAEDAISGYTADVDAIDRVSIKRNGELQFCVSPTTWWGWRDGAVVHHYALNDPKIPLSRWAQECRIDPACVLAYRPGRRLVLLDRARRRVIKGYRAGHSEPARIRHQMAASVAGGGAFRVPQLLEALPSLEALAFEYCVGQPCRLATLGRSERQSLVAGVLVWQASSQSVLASLQSAATPLSSWHPAKELAVLEDWREKIRIAGLALPANWLAVLEKLASSLPDSGIPVFVHRDLHDGQVLFHDSAPVVFDFDQLAYGDPAVDLGNLVAHDQLRALQHPAAAVCDRTRAAACKLWLDEGLPDSDTAKRVYWYTATSLLRLALVYAIRPRWQRLAPSLVVAGELAANAVAREGV